MQTTNFERLRYLPIPIDTSFHMIVLDIIVLRRHLLLNSHEKTLASGRIGVIGLGYVGLPLALLLVKIGFHVVGIDLDNQKITKLVKGTSYLPDILDHEIQAAFSTERFVAIDDYNMIRSLTTIIICVPTPLTQYRTPDLSHLQRVGKALIPRLQKGQLIILESSTYPGTTTEVLKPMLEKSGLKVGADLFLAYSPERIDPGNTSIEMVDIPKVLSGVTKKCSEKANQFYSQIFNKVVLVSSPEAAELTKLLENTHRFINISFINELAIICEKMNIDIWEVIDAASTKPYGFTPFYPGPGIGGHCIPVDPLYLQWKAQQYETKSYLIEYANKINLEMPNFIVEKLKNSLDPKVKLKDAKILIYGVTYKRNVNDVRESSALEIIKLLEKEGVQISYHDPYVPVLKIGGQTLHHTELSNEVLQQSHCVLLITDHSGIPIQQIIDNTPLVLDTRNITRGMQGKARIIRLGGQL